MLLLLFDKCTYYQSGQYDKGLQLFFQMCSERVQFDTHAFTTVFAIGGKVLDKTIAKEIYSKWEQSGLYQFSSAASIVMFIKCDMLDTAWHISNCYLYVIF